MESFKKKEVLNIRRSHIVEDMMEIYSKDATIPSCDVIISFKGEKAIDVGGVKNEAFSLFWEEICKPSHSLFHGENVKVPIVNAANASANRTVFKLLGTIMSHTFVLTGVFPVQICLPSVAFAITGNDEVPESILLEQFMMFLPAPDRDLITVCLNRNDHEPYSDEVSKRLLEFYSLNGLNHLPSKSKLYGDILGLARHIMIYQPMCALSSMSSGYTKFYCSVNTLNELLTIYKRYDISVGAVLKALTITIDKALLTPAQERVMHYLKTFIRESDVTLLKKLVRFVTGVPALFNSNIAVDFNSATGLSRAPHASVCGKVLILPCTYQTYSEFKEEFTQVLLSEESFLMLRI